MRKLIMLLAVLSMLFLTLGFVACDDGDSSFEWGAPIVDGNIEVEEPDEDAEEEVNDSVVDMMDVYFDIEGDYEVLDTDYVAKGIIPVKNSAGYVGFYSLHYQKMLIAPQYKAEWVDWEIKPIEQLGYLLEIEYEDKIVTYDAMGNKVLEIEDADKVLSDIYYVMYDKADEDLENNDETCAQLQITFEEDREKFGYYENTSYVYYDYATGECTTGYSLKLNKVVEEEDEYEGPSAGDLFVTENKIVLDDFEGLEGYYLIESNNVYYIYDSSNIVKGSYAVEDGYNVIQIGGSLILQERVVVADDASDYDFCVSGYYTTTKYKLHTIAVDILNGEVEDLDFEYVISDDSAPYKNEEGKAVYSLVLLAKINDDKTVSQGVIYGVINKNGEVVKEMTGIPATSFVKIGENFYNTVNEIIYSKDLKELAYIGDIYPQLDEVNELFIGVLDGKLGAIDYNGKVAIEFKYDSLTPLDAYSLPTGALIDAKNDYILAERNGEIYKVNIRKGTETYVCAEDEIVTVEDDLYKVTRQDGEYIKYISQSEEYFTIDNTSEYIYSPYNGYFTSSSDIVNAKYIFMYDAKMYDSGIPDDSSDDTEKLKIYTFNVNNFANHNSFTTIGTEKTDDVVLGRYQGDKITMVEGVNKLSLIDGTGVIYTTFTPSEDGTYVFASDDLDRVVIMDELWHELDTNYATSDAETKIVLLELEKDKVYNIIVALDDDYDPVIIEKLVEGKYKVEPIGVMMGLEQEEIEITLPAGQKYVYVGISPALELLEYPQYKYTVTHNYTSEIEINYTVTRYGVNDTIYSDRVDPRMTWEMPISTYEFAIVRENYGAEETIKFTFKSNMPDADKLTDGTLLNPYVIKASDTYKTQSVYLGYDDYTVPVYGYYYDNIIRTRYLKYENDSNAALIVNLNIDNTASYYRDYGCVVSTNGFVTPTDLTTWDGLITKVINEIELTEAEIVEYERLLALGIIGGATDKDYTCELLVNEGEDLFVYFMGPQTDAIDVTITEYAVNNVNKELTFNENNYDKAQKVYYKATKDGYYYFNAIATLVDNSTMPATESDYYNYSVNCVVYRVDGTTYSAGTYYLDRLFLNEGDVVICDFALNTTPGADQEVKIKAVSAGAMPASVEFTEDDETVKYFVYTATKDGYYYLDTSATIDEVPYDKSYEISYTTEYYYSDNYGQYTIITPNTPIYLTKGEQIVVMVNVGYPGLATGETLEIALAFKSYTASTAAADVTFEYAAQDPIETKSYEYTISATGFYNITSTALKSLDGAAGVEYSDYTAKIYYGGNYYSWLDLSRLLLTEGETIVIEYTLDTSLLEGETVNIDVNIEKLNDVAVRGDIPSAGGTYQLIVAEETTYKFVLKTSYYGTSYTSVTVRDENGGYEYSYNYIDWTQNGSDYEYKTWFTLSEGAYTVEFQRSEYYNSEYSISVYPEVAEYTFNSSSSKSEVFDNKFETNYRDVRINITNDTDTAKFYEVDTNLSNLRVIKNPGEETENKVGISNGQIIKLEPGQAIAITGMAYYTDTEYSFRLVNITDGAYWYDEDTNTTVAYKVVTPEEYKQIKATLDLSSATASVYMMDRTLAGNPVETIYGGGSATNWVYENITYIVRITVSGTNSSLAGYLTYSYVD